MKLPDTDRYININSYVDGIGYYKCTAQLAPKYLKDDSIITPNEDGICSYCLCNYSGLPSGDRSIRNVGLCTDCYLYKYDSRRDYIYIIIELDVDDIIKKSPFKRENL